MSTHKDLPPGSQQWARELDDALKEIKRLQGVVSRLADNAGLDMANPRRGLNDGPTPSVKNPVGQKLSSLADVATYNVSDKQVLSWSQQGQKWLPVPLPGPAGTVDISALSYSGLTEGYGTVVSPSKYAYTAAGIKGTAPATTYAYSEVWATDSTYIGAGNEYSGSGYSLIELAGDVFSRPYVAISAYDFNDNSSATLNLYSYGVRIDGAYFVAGRISTANRPAALGTTDQRRGAMLFDTDLNIPIWWNGTTWINALGTAV